MSKRDLIFIPQTLIEREEFLHEMMLKLTGLDSRAKNRLRGPVLARTFIAYQLRLDGYLIEDIGLVLGRDHSTIIYYIKLMNDYLSVPCYKTERKIWKEFKKKI